MKKIVSVVCVFVFGLPLLSAVTALGHVVANAEEMRYEAELDEKESYIAELYAKRMEAIVKNEGEAVDKLTRELYDNGVQKLSIEELYAQVDMPVACSTVENFTAESYESEVLYKSQKCKYKVITLTPKNTDCNLSIRGSFSSQRKKAEKAWSSTFLSVATTALGFIPNFGAVISVYEVLKDCYENFSKLSVVSDVDAVYTWSLAESCSFHYAQPPEGISGSYALYGRYNIVSGYVGGTVLSLKYDADSNTATGTGANYSYNVNIAAPDFSSGRKTALEYLENRQEIDQRVKSIDIIGVDGSVVHKAALFNPLYPMIVR